MSFAFGLELELLEKERAWKEKRAVYMKEYKRKNKEILKERYSEYNREYTKKNKGRWKKKAKKLIPGSPEHIKRKAQARKRHEKNKDKVNEARRIQRANLDPEVKLEMNRKSRKRANEKCKTDPALSAMKAIKTRILQVLNGKPKKQKTQVGRFQRYFGCSPEVFTAHIEGQFTDGMTWENRGTFWHLDHIVPFSLGGDNYDLLLKLNHYKNLQPLVVAENVRKGKMVPDIWPEGVPFTREELGLPSVPCPSPVSVLTVLVSV